MRGAVLLLWRMLKFLDNILGVALAFVHSFLTWPCSVENLQDSARYLSMKTNPHKNRLRQFSTLALAVSKSVLPNHGSRFAPKTYYTQPQLLACLLLKEYLRLDYRTTVPLRKCLSFLTHCARLSNCLGYPITLLFGGLPGTS